MTLIRNFLSKVLPAKPDKETYGSEKDQNEAVLNSKIGPVDPAPRANLVDGDPISSDPVDRDPLECVPVEQPMAMQNVVDLPLAKVQHPQPSQQEIADLAAELWNQQGQPVGKDTEFWLRAENELRLGNSG